VRSIRTAAIRLAVAVQDAHAPEHVVIVRADALVEDGAVTRKTSTFIVEIGHAYALALCTAGAWTPGISGGTAAFTPTIFLGARAVPGNSSEGFAFLRSHPLSAPLGNRLGAASSAAVIAAVVIAFRQAARTVEADFSILAGAVLRAGLAVLVILGFADRVGAARPAVQGGILAGFPELGFAHAVGAAGNAAVLRAVVGMLALCADVVSAHLGSVADARFQARARHVAKGTVLSLGCPEALLTLLAVLHRPAGRVLHGFDAPSRGVVASPEFCREGHTRRLVRRAVEILVAAVSSAQHEAVSGGIETDHGTFRFAVAVHGQTAAIAHGIPTQHGVGIAAETLVTLLVLVVRRIFAASAKGPVGQVRPRRRILVRLTSQAGVLGYRVSRRIVLPTDEAAVVSKVERAYSILAGIVGAVDSVVAFAARSTAAVRAAFDTVAFGNALDAVSCRATFLPFFAIPTASTATIVSALSGRTYRLANADVVKALGVREWTVTAEAAIVHIKFECSAFRQHPAHVVATRSAIPVILVVNRWLTVPPLGAGAALSPTTIRPTLTASAVGRTDLLPTVHGLGQYRHRIHSILGLVHQRLRPGTPCCQHDDK